MIKNAKYDESSLSKRYEDGKPIKPDKLEVSVKLSQVGKITTLLKIVLPLLRSFRFDRKGSEPFKQKKNFFQGNIFCHVVPAKTTVRKQFSA